MLLRFSVENFKCFKAETTLSMIASNEHGLELHRLKSKQKNRPDALKLASIYGPNGHGKTKFVDAVNYLQDLVVNKRKPDDEFEFFPFMLDRKSKKKPTRLVINFRVESTDFEYGAVVNHKGFVEEWLFAKYNVREVLIFERVLKKKSNQFDYEFGPSLKRSKIETQKFKTEEYLDFLGFEIGRHQSFLSEAVERGVEILAAPFDWFKKTLIVVPASASYGSLFNRMRKDKKFAKFAEDFIKKSDIGISRIKAEEQELTSALVSELLEESESHELKKLAESKDRGAVVMGSNDGPHVRFERERDGKLTVTRLVSEHIDDEGNSVSFDFTDESSGTRRLLDIIPILESRENSPKVFIVDELDRKLHAILAYDFISKFGYSAKNQLIFTTHNIFLLSLELFRRDEIWFMQKNDLGCVELYSLSDFKVRNDLDVRKGYLFGRFGAIPLLDSVDFESY